MPNIAEVLGLKQPRNLKNEWITTLFYFIKEFKINPLPEEYEVIPVYREDKIVKYKIKKLAMDWVLFNQLINQMNEHYKKEEAEINKIKMKHG